MNTVVYYPHFYPSEAWLRMGALLWDRIYTMQLDDTSGPPDALHALDQALGGVMAVTRPWDQMATDEPGQTMRGITRSDETTTLFADWLDHRSDELTEMVAPSTFDSSTLAALFPGKMHGPIARLLDDRGLLRDERRLVDSEIANWELESFEDRYLEQPARVVTPEPGSDHERHEALVREAVRNEIRGDNEAAIHCRAAANEIRARNLVSVQDTLTTRYLPRDVALHYLSLCASRLAQLGKRDVVTDRGQFTDAILTSDAQLRGDVATTLLEAHLPTDLATLNPARLAECRSELSTKRLKFQTEVHAVVQEFSAAASVDTYNTLKGQLVDIANERIDQTRRAYRTARLEVSTQALTISLTPPALATAAASALGIGLLGPIGLSAALSLFAASKVIDWRQAGIERNNSPWSYVLEISRLG